MIQRKRRTRILIDGSPALRRQLAAEITKAYRLLEVEEPNHGLTMIRMRETAHSSLFFLGEILVTEAKVQIEGVTGLGILAGDDPAAARDLAIIDAAYNAHLPQTSAWDELLAAEERRLTRKRDSYEARLSETRVRFETMDVD